MGTVFEELIRKFADISNETAESTSPRARSSASWSTSSWWRMTTCWPGTGGMLSVAGEYLAEHNPQARLTMYGSGIELPHAASRLHPFGATVRQCAPESVRNPPTRSVLLPVPLSQLRNTRSE